jgi:outer membrane lipoprotein carrier protein
MILEVGIPIIRKAGSYGRTAKIVLLHSLFTALLLMLSFTLCLAQEDHVTKIQKAYEDIKDIRGNFVQKSSIKDLKRTDTYNGRFFIKPPKMKWEYTGMKPQVIYINGDEIIIYQQKENQVIKSKFDRATYGQAPIALLAGLGDIRQEFVVISDSPGRLVIKPRKPMGNIDHLELTPSDNAFPIKALIIVDSLSNRIEITLNDVKTNTGLKNSLFNFTPPKDATVLEN